MTATKDQRTGWLKELKAGDRVGVLNTMGVLGRTMTVEVVKDITTTGEIVLADTTIPANGIKQSGLLEQMKQNKGALCLVTLSVKSLR